MAGGTGGNAECGGKFGFRGSVLVNGPPGASKVATLSPPGRERVYRMLEGKSCIQYSTTSSESWVRLGGVGGGGLKENKDWVGKIFPQE